LPVGEGAPPLGGCGAGGCGAGGGGGGGLGAGLGGVVEGVGLGGVEGDGDRRLLCTFSISSVVSFISSLSSLSCSLSAPLPVGEGAPPLGGCGAGGRGAGGGGGPGAGLGGVVEGGQPHGDGAGADPGAGPGAGGLCAVAFLKPPPHRSTTEFILAHIFFFRYFVLNWYAPSRRPSP